jgi:nucleotide-binding universal stress UspA family protein
MSCHGFSQGKMRKLAPKPCGAPFVQSATMPCMKTIVVAIDLNEADKPVLKEACHLAKATGATLQLVHVFPRESTAMDYVVYVPVDPEKRKAAMAEERKQLEALVADLEKQGIKAEATLRVERASRGILALAEEVDADAIVVGTHSRNVVSRALIGGTADRIVRRSPVPVLVVPTVK